MIDERAEFTAYTGAVVYDATNKQDSAYLGRFSLWTPLLPREGGAEGADDCGPRLPVADR